MYNVALEILNILNKRGYEAYIVGGYVRDKLLGIVSNDIDITTNALPNDISNVFNIKLKDNYGSCNLYYKNYNFDITTYRKESNYLNNRRPNHIEYVNNLSDDLKRRDFTINTICIDRNGNYVDLLNGIDDLKNRVIKSVGDPYLKLKQDSLRILRAIRFSCLYDFDIDNDLKNAIIANKEYINSLSFDRIKNELNDIFNCGNCNYAIKMINEFNLFENLKIKRVNSVVVTKNYLSIWSQLDFDSGYNFSNEEKKSINQIRYIVNNKCIDSYILYHFDLNNVLEASKILNIDIDVLDEYSKIKIHNRKDINITYDEVKSVVKNKNINNVFIDLEKQILYNKLENNKKSIINYLKEGESVEQKNN